MSTPSIPDGVTLEDMTEADLPVVARLEASLFGAEAWSQDLLAGELTAASGGDRRYVVARGPCPVPGPASTGLSVPGPASDPSQTGSAGTGGSRALAPADPPATGPADPPLAAPAGPLATGPASPLTAAPANPSATGPKPGEREGARGAAGAGGRILGYAGMWVGDGAGDADLLTIATIPQARRRKVASRLLTELMGTARRAGCRAVLLEVRVSNAAAQSLYATHGFTRIGLRRRYYQAPQEDAVVMRALLRPAPAPVGSQPRARPGRAAARGARKVQAPSRAPPHRPLGFV